MGVVLLWWWVVCLVECLCVVEVVLVDDATTDATAQAMSEVQGDFIVLRNEARAGFPAAWAQAALASSGEILIALRHDAAVRPGAPELSVAWAMAVSGRTAQKAAAAMVVRRIGMNGLRVQCVAASPQRKQS